MADDEGLLGALLAATHLVVPDDVPALIDEHGRRLGASSAVVYLADREQHFLVPLSGEGTASAEEAAIDRTLAGRSYRLLEILHTVDEDGNRTVWVPVIDGTERLGVLRFVFRAKADANEELLRAFSGLVAELVLTKSAYGDFFELARRRRPMTVAAELLWQLLPPLTFATEDLVITGAFVPASDLGGDAFDYSVGDGDAEVAIFDGMGHGLNAGLLATTAVAAYRNARRNRFDLSRSATHIGRAIEDHFDDSRFVTGLLTSFARATGRLSWCTAGHPPPLLLRHGRVVKTLESGTGLPFGVGPASAVFQEQLEPRDRVLLYTDGVTEARSASGEFFGLDQLTDLLIRTAGDDPAPEAMRRLMHAIEEHNDGAMRDDATVVMIEWHGSGGGLLEV